MTSAKEVTDKEFKKKFTVEIDIKDSHNPWTSMNKDYYEDLCNRLRELTVQGTRQQFLIDIADIIEGK